jgi:hypothetical protein
MPEVTAALKAYAEGKHPSFGAVPQMASCPVYSGRY